MDHYCAPQWVDFSSSPQLPSDDYFEQSHDIYEPKLCINIHKNNIKLKRTSEIIETPKKSIQIQDENFIKSTSNPNENYEIETNDFKNTPIKVIYPLKGSASKHEVVRQVTYDNVLQEAMQNVQFCGNLHKVKKVIDLSSTEDIFKKPIPIKSKSLKPVKIQNMDKSIISISSSEEMQSITENLPKEIESLSSDIDAIKLNSNSSMKITEDITKIPETKELLKNNITEETVKNDNSKTRVNDKTVQLKLSNTKPQIYAARTSVTTKANTFNKFVTTYKQMNKKESKSKTVKKDQSKSKLLQHDSINSTSSTCSTTSKKTSQNNNRVLDRSSTVKIKQTPRSSSSSLCKQEKISARKSTTSNKIVSTIVYNTGPEIVIKKEKILFFDIPMHTKQKKTTRPVPFSFENRDKIKKSSKETTDIESKSVSDKKTVLGFNKIQKDKNKFANFAKKGVTTFCNRKVINTKHEGNKQPEIGGKINTYTTSVTLRKPMRSANTLKDNNQKKDENKISINKIENIKDKKGANKVQEPLRSVSCTNIHTNKNLKIQSKISSKINKCAEKENKQPNIKVSSSKNDDVNKKGITLKSTGMKIIVNERNKRCGLEGRMKQTKIMHEEKLRKEREEKLAQEKLEIAKLRKQAEIKARPMPVYKPLIHIKSTKPLTKPQSPAWWSKHKVTMTKETL